MEPAAGWQSADLAEVPVGQVTGQRGPVVGSLGDARGWLWRAHDWVTMRAIFGQALVGLSQLSCLTPAWLLLALVPLSHRKLASGSAAQSQVSLK